MQRGETDFYGDGLTALHHAARRGMLACVKAIVKANKATLEMATLVTKHRVAPFIRGGHTPLFSAVIGQQSDIVKVLVNTLGAKVNHKGAQGRTPLWWARNCTYTCPEIIDTLVSANAKEEGPTAVQGKDQK